MWDGLDGSSECLTSGEGHEVCDLNLNLVIMQRINEYVFKMVVNKTTVKIGIAKLKVRHCIGRMC